jgi:hypothetical protein
MKKHSLFLLTLVLLAVYTNIAKCDSNALYEFSLDPPACYVPTKVIFNFPTTTNATLQDVSTISQSPTGYSYEGNPTSFTFIAKEVDIYTFTFAIHYENVTAANQTRTVLISWWSGTLAPGGSSITTTQADVVVHMRLSLTLQPRMPTGEEIAELEFHLVEQRFVEMFDQLTIQNKKIADLTTTNTWLTVIALVCACLAIFLGLANIRVRRGPK